MINEFYLLYQYRKIQQAAATTDIKTLEQILVKFRKVVAERRAEYYAEIGGRGVKAGEIEKMRDLMYRDGIRVEDLLAGPH
ncbi:DNA-binding protein [bacteria symbiont BFo1 of Frankliniella occidentalis]|uniref:H-NS family histone-like protein n=1 Tax=Pantoea anthophila TaxID=470931 RepID=UPI00066475D3|nr:DNA-binding protein [Pantoea anthophila]KMV67152.1 DNA-binding protein [bacteria symbiont BFo1 of Frankliniella occidentalis]KYP82231.1 DNA-binding protein [bacteria symbiont BFo1 of Frankliniella occidentalis]MDQ1214432.1 DNA-binding protein H-NS [Pantoea anthophila]